MATAVLLQDVGHLVAGASGCIQGHCRLLDFDIRGSRMINDPNLPRSSLAAQGRQTTSKQLTFLALTEQMGRTFNLNVRG